MLHEAADPNRTRQRSYDILEEISMLNQSDPASIHGGLRLTEHGCLTESNKVGSAGVDDATGLEIQ